VNYIHLNPVRAGMVSLENLKDYGSSSYPKFFKKRLPKYLDRERFLGALEFPNSGKGMKQYAKHLEFSEEADPKERENLGKRYCRGWAVASKEYRKELKKMYAGLKEPAGWGGPEVIELREEKWQGVLEELLKEADKKREDVELSPKTAEWKVRIAKRLRETTTARNAWIAENLAMGHSSRVTNAIRGYSILWDPFWRPNRVSTLWTIKEIANRHAGAVKNRNPSEDPRILADDLTFQLQCVILLTGDKTHFGPLDGKTVSGVTIHSPASLAVFST